jgi:hypothetical protein
MDKDTQDISKSLEFIIEHMLMKEDLDELRVELKADIARLDVGLKTVDSKVSGIDKRLDIEAGYRDDMKIPARVSDLETKVFGKSREPKVAA